MFIKRDKKLCKCKLQEITKQTKIIKNSWITTGIKTPSTFHDCDPNLELLHIYIRVSICFTINRQHRVNKYNGSVVLWVAHLTRNYSVWSLSPDKSSRVSLEQETLQSLKEYWSVPGTDSSVIYLFHNQTKINEYKLINTIKFNHSYL